MSSFCGQLKLYANDGKKYKSEVINEHGVKLLLSIIPAKYKKAIQDWLAGLLDPTNETYIKTLLQDALTNKINDRELFLKGIDYSYYYEEID